MQKRKGSQHRKRAEAFAYVAHQSEEGSEQPGIGGSESGELREWGGEWLAVKRSQAREEFSVRVRVRRPDYKGVQSWSRRERCAKLKLERDEGGMWVSCLF